MKRGVIVLGGHVQGYGIVRIFGEYNIQSIVLDASRVNIARFSKYCKRFVRCDYDNVINDLIKLGKSKDYYNWLLIPTDDFYVKILSQNRVLLSKYFQNPVDSWDKIELFFNKKYSYPITEKLDIPTPETHYPKSLQDLTIISDNISYPCIIKPSIMLNFFKIFKQKVFLCNNKIELIENYKRAVEVITPNEILIQDVIPGNSDNLYSVGLYFDKTECHNYLIAKRKRQHPLDFGNATTYAHTCHVPELLDYATKLLSEVNYSGICEVEYKFDQRDNKYKFLEVNPRPWKWHLLAEAAHVPILLSLFHAHVGDGPICTNKFDSAAWSDIITDIPVRIQLFFKKEYSLTNTERLDNFIHAVYNKKDLSPFLMQVILLPYFIFKR